MVVSEDGDSDVRVEVSGRVWTFNAACCTRLAPMTNAADKKKHHSERGDETSSDDDDDDDDDENEQEIRTFCLFNVLLLLLRLQ